MNLKLTKIDSKPILYEKATTSCAMYLFWEAGLKLINKGAGLVKQSWKLVFIALSFFETR